jgi:sulfur dioxygenase
MSKKSKMIFQQMIEPETSTYTYLLADPDSKEAVLIDTVREYVQRDYKLLNELGLKLKYVLDTHIHADHITGAGELRKLTGAQTAQSVHGQNKCADLQLTQGQILKFGNFEIKVLETPGHTDGCMSFYCDGKVFTGDSLMIRSAGRTDFQQGSPLKLYESITQKLYALPLETEVYPGHDYKGMTVSTIEAEKNHNPRISSGVSQEQFANIMNNLKLPPPKKIAESVPANLKCGILEDPKLFHPKMMNQVPEVSPQEVLKLVKEAYIIDVRSNEEFTGELGHIAGSQLVTLGPPLMKFLNEMPDKNKEIVFVCRGGVRSAQAVLMSHEFGYKNTISMNGGMSLWNELGFPTEK